MIRLSEKHGVNPSIDLCFFCGKEKGLVLTGRIRGDAKAPHETVWTMEPCETCEGYMQQGIILVEVQDGESGKNPYRTGIFHVVTEDAFKRIFKNADEVLETRFCWIPESVSKAVGLHDIPEISPDGNIIAPQ